MYERRLIDKVKSFLAGTQQMAYLPMQFGYMIWCAPHIVLAIDYDGITWSEYLETWDGEDYGSTESLETGLYVPQRGFGYVWHANTFVRELGYAITPEVAYYGTCTRTDDGWNFTLPSGERITLGGEEPEEDPPSYGYSNWVWLPTLDIPLNLFTVAFIGREDTGGGMVQFGHNIVLSLPKDDLEHVLEVLKERI